MEQKIITNKLKFSNKELLFLADSDLLIRKRFLQDKISSLLELTETALEPIVSSFGKSLTNDIPQAKISKGENYLKLPYMVLDYPALFSKKNVFAYRTMFYWGNFFSTTLHLQGKYLEKNRQRLFKATDVLINKKTYISTGVSPWHYHYGSDNYQLLSQDNCAKFLSDPFIKISDKIELDEWHNLPEIAAGNLQKILQIITD